MSNYTIMLIQKQNLYNLFSYKTCISAKQCKYNNNNGDVKVDLYNAIGLTGTFIYLISYFLLMNRKIDGNGTKYIIMNGVAAFFVLISLLEHWNLPSFVIQSCWIVFSAVGLIKISLASRKSKILVDK